MTNNKIICEHEWVFENQDYDELIYPDGSVKSCIIEYSICEKCQATMKSYYAYSHDEITLNESD